jgi:hypothetical protein
MREYQNGFHGFPAASLPTCLILAIVLAFFPLPAGSQVFDTTPPQVFPPKDITISHTQAGGAQARDSKALQDFLAGGKARDNADSKPTRLPPQVNAADATSDTVFPEGTTSVIFRFQDAAGNIGSASAGVTVLDFEDGDLFVGGGIGDNGFGGFESWGIYRVRGEQATLYCQAGQGDDYWTLPTHVLVDSQARIVFLANLSPFLSGNTGLLRCDSLGAPPEKLAAFRVPGAGPSPGYQDPFPDKSFLEFNGLHLETSHQVTIDDNTNNGLPQISGGDSYVLAFSPPGTRTDHAASLRYFPATNQWADGPPVGDVGSAGGSGATPDMTFHNGNTYAIHGGRLFRYKKGLQVDVSGTAGSFNFGLTLSLFGGSSELSNALTEPICGECGLLVHDLIAPAVDSGCTPNPPASSVVATGVLTGDYITYDEYTGHGLVVGTGEVGAGAPFLTNISEKLLDKPGDLSQYFTNPGLGCVLEPEVYFTSVLPFFGAHGINGFTPLVSSTHGIVGVTGSGVALMAPGIDPTDQAFLINNQPWILGAGFHSGLGAWPPQVSSGDSADIIVRVDSPVDVIVTSPDGRKIGVDASGQQVNDFGQDGFDSGPGEPRFFAINNPLVGAYSAQLTGTGNGPFAVHVYSNDLTIPIGSHIVTTGTASLGSSASADFNVGPDFRVSFASQAAADTTPPISVAAVSPAANTAGWRKSNLSVTLTAADEADGSGVKQITYSATGAQTIGNTTVALNSTLIPITSEGQTTITFFATDNAGNIESPKQVTVMLDETPPTVSCGTADTLWHAADVSVACAAHDTSSGLANSADTNFGLTTSVPAGTETANASTGSHQVCDVAGNCANAGPIGGNMIDKKPPSISITAPASGAYLLNQAVLASYSCMDSGSGIATCAGSVASGAKIDTSSLGSNTFTVSATDKVGNAAGPQSVNYSVGYKVCILYDPTRSVQSGSTIPLKIQLCDANNNDASTPTVVVHAVKLVQNTTSASEMIQTPGNANPDNDFRYDGTLGLTGGYIFNLSTKGLGTGSYVLTFSAGTDPTAHVLVFQVR